jgi:hypothetical protein
VPDLYNPELQQALAASLTTAATISLSVTSVTYNRKGGVQQVAISMSLVDIKYADRSLVSSEVYGLSNDDEGQSLDFKGPGFDWVVFVELQKLTAAVSSHRLNDTRASITSKGPSIRIVWGSRTVASKIEQGAIPRSTELPSPILVTKYRAVPLHVFVNSESPLKSVLISNETSKIPRSLYTNKQSFDQQRYFDETTSIDLVEGENQIQVTAEDASRPNAIAIRVLREVASGLPISVMYVAPDNEFVRQGDSDASRGSMDLVSALTSVQTIAPVVTLSGNEATHDSVMGGALAIDEDARSVGGASLIYYRGQIVTGKDGAYLIPSDAHSGQALITGIPIEELTNTWAPRLLFIDACIDPGRSADRTLIGGNPLSGGKTGDAKWGTVVAVRSSISDCRRANSSVSLNALITALRSFASSNVPCLSASELVSAPTTESFTALAATPGLCVMRK